MLFVYWKAVLVSLLEFCSHCVKEKLKAVSGFNFAGDVISNALING